MSSSHTIKADSFKVSTDGQTNVLEISKGSESILKGDWKVDGSLKVEQGTDAKSPVTVSHLTESLVQFQKDCSEFWVPREEWEKTSNKTVEENTNRINAIEEQLKGISAKEEIDQALANFYSKGEIDSVLGNFYSKGDINKSFTNYYSKSEIDSSFTGVVHKSGDEYVQGNKTFLNNVVVANNQGTAGITVLPLGTKTNLGADAYGLHVSAMGGLQLFGTHFLNGDLFEDSVTGYDQAVKIIKNNVSVSSTDLAAIGFDYANKVTFRTMPNDGNEATYALEAWQWTDDSHSRKAATAGVKFLKPSQKTAFEKSSVLNMEEGDARWGAPDLSTYLSKSEASSTYLAKSDVQDTYVSKSEISYLDSIVQTQSFISCVLASTSDEESRRAISTEFSSAISDYYYCNSELGKQFISYEYDNSGNRDKYKHLYEGKNIVINFNISRLFQDGGKKYVSFFPEDIDIPIVLPNLKGTMFISVLNGSATFNQPVFFPNVIDGVAGTLITNCPLFDQPVLLPKARSFDAVSIFEGTGISAKNIAIMLNSLPKYTDDKKHNLSLKGVAGAKKTATTETFEFTICYSDNTISTYGKTVKYSYANCPTFDNDDENQTLRRAFVMAIHKGWTITF